MQHRVTCRRTRSSDWQLMWRMLCISRRICRAQASGGALHLGTDFTKQALFDAGTRAALAASGLPLCLHFGWHMTCEEIQRLLRLDLKV